MSVSVVTFDPKYRTEFARLNYAWITTLFAVEPLDQLVLDNPEREILEHGGEVFFAIEDECVAGTVALKRIDAESFELTKMAVDETRRGRGYGRLLLNEALAFARKRNAARVVLSSHTSLTPAIAMYREAGFVERTNADSCYSRCNIYMQKELRT